MERIKINEVDNTVSASNTDDTEVVYVPGFAWTGSDGQDEIASKYRVPVLCTTLGEFEMNFGTTAPRFKTNQMYKMFSPANTDGFLGSALPNTYETIPWFAGETEVFDDANAKDPTYILGDADPSYTYAKELISKGVAVVYERMNKSTVYPKNISIWKASKAYGVNQKVVAVFDGVEHYFICKTNHTSGATFDATERVNWEIFKGFDVYDEQSKPHYKAGDIIFVPDSEGSGGVYKEVVSNEPSTTHTFAESVYNKDHEGGYKRGDIVTISDGVNNLRRVVCFNDVAAGVDFSRDNFFFNTNDTTSQSPSWRDDTPFDINTVVSRTLTETDLTKLSEFDESKIYIYGDFVKNENEYYVCIVEKTVAGDFNINNFSPVTPGNYSIVFRCVAPSTGNDPWDEYIAEPNNGSDIHWITNFFDMEVKNSDSDPTEFEDAKVYYWVVDPNGQGQDKSYFKCHKDSNIVFKTIPQPENEVPMYDVNVDTFYKNVGGTIEDGLDSTYSCVFDAANGTLLDASRFNIKYFTTGAYPNFEYMYAKSNTNLANKMAQFAATRGDAIAMIDHTDKPERPLVGTDSVYGAITGEYGIPSEFATFATMVTPWASYRSTNTLGASGLLMPGSYGYFDALANTKKYYTTWLPVAGTTRGVVTNLITTHTDRILTNTIADNYQVDPNRTGISINAITYINNYGYCVWGNRTLMNLTSDSKGFAALFLNLRNVMSDIKKQAFATAQRYMFEQVDVQLWIKFKYMMSSMLDRMKDYGVVADYQFIQNKVTDKTKLSCTIKVWPVYSAESFEIGIVLTDEDVNVE